MSATMVPFSPFPQDAYDSLAMQCGVYPVYSGIVKIEDFPYTRITITDDAIEEENVYPEDEKGKDILMDMFLLGK